MSTPVTASPPPVAVDRPLPGVRRSTPESWVALVVFAALVVVFAMEPSWGDPSTANDLIRLFTLLCLAQMWNLLAGYAGLVSIGQQAYIGIGAYTLVWFGNVHGVDVFWCVPLAALVAAVFALPLAGIAFRLRGGYFAIGTWVIAEVLRLLVSNSDTLGAGTGTSVTAVIGIDLETRQHVTYWLALGAGVGSIVLVWLLLRSRLGTALTAARDAEVAAGALGVRSTRARLVAYVVAAAGCGFAGAVIYLDLLRVQPSAAFSVDWSAFMIFMVVIGGIGTIEGPIIGAVVFFLLERWLADWGSWYLVLLGVLAIAVTIKAPNGLWGLVRARWDLRLLPTTPRLRGPT
jgi:branched-chain amino acid transport system permease protein